MVRGKPWYGELMTFLVALAMGMMLSVTFFQVRLYKLSYLWNFISLRNRSSLFQKLLECLMFVACSKIAPKLYRIDLKCHEIQMGSIYRAFAVRPMLETDWCWTKCVGDNIKCLKFCHQNHCHPSIQYHFDPFKGGRRYFRLYITVCWETMVRDINWWIGTISNGNVFSLYFYNNSLWYSQGIS